MGSGLRSVARQDASWRALAVAALLAACGSSERHTGDDSTPRSGAGGVASPSAGRAGAVSGAGDTLGGRAGTGGTGTAGTMRGGSSGVGGSSAGRAGGAAAGSAGLGGGGPAGEGGMAEVPRPPPGWTEAVPFPVPDETISSARPVVTIETTGVAHVLVLAQDLLVASFEAPGKFGTPELLDSEYVKNRAALGIDPNDVSIAVWPGPSTSTRNGELMASRHPPGGPWSTPVAVGVGSRDVDELTLAVAANGTAVAAWMVPTAAVRYSHFDGTSWSDPLDIASFVSNQYALPSVALDANGKGLVVWRDAVPADVIGASRFDGTSFDAPTDLCPESAMECYLPAVAVNAAGDGVAAFELDYNLSTVAFDRTLGWQAPERVATTTDRADYGAAPQLGYSASNDLLAIWREEVTAYDFRCMGAVKTSAGWSAPARLQPEPGETDNKAMAVAPDGRAVAIWATHGHDTTGSRFWASYYLPTSGWEPAFVLDEGGTVSGAEVAAAINPKGQAVLAWTRWASPPRVRVARYDPP